MSSGEAELLIALLSLLMLGSIGWALRVSKKYTTLSALLENAPLAVLGQGYSNARARALFPGHRFPFDTGLTLSQGEETYLVCRGEGSLWCADITAHQHTLEQRIDLYKTLLDTLPLPMWWLMKKEEEHGYNRAFSYLPITASPPFREDGSTLLESRTVTYEGKRSLFEFYQGFTEEQGGIFVGFALDMTALETTQRQLADHVASHQQVLKYLRTALAAFTPEKRLTFFNEAFVRMWGLERSFLERCPTLREILDELMIKNKLPSMLDFSQYKASQDLLFQGLSGASSDILHLPDERTLDVTALPHPLGVVLTYEDITETLILERTHKTLLSTQERIFSLVRDGILVFGRDGRLRFWNDAFLSLWSLDFLQEGAHIEDIFSFMEPHTSTWNQVKDSLLCLLSENTEEEGTASMIHGGSLAIVYASLPGQGCLMLCRAEGNSDGREK